MKNTKNICIVGIGIALFVALSMCLRVPIFENYYLCLGYIVMSVYCYSYGPIYGSIVGTAGTILYCLLINGLRGMPGWAIGNIIIGLIMGTWFKTIKGRKSILLDALSIGMIVLSVSLGILCCKSFIECILYAQPMGVRVANNIFAVVSEVVVLVTSLPICKRVDYVLRSRAVAD